jgi:hypothetical protein
MGRRFAWVVFGLVTILSLVWCVGALHFTGPRPELLANAADQDPAFSQRIRDGLVRPSLLVLPAGA